MLQRRKKVERFLLCSEPPPTSLLNLSVKRHLLEVLVVLHELHPIRVVSPVLCRVVSAHAGHAASFLLGALQRDDDPHLLSLLGHGGNLSGRRRAAPQGRRRARAPEALTRESSRATEDHRPSE